MRVRRGDHLDLTGILQLLVQRQHAPDHFEDFVKNDLFIFFGKVAALLNQFLQRRFRQEIRVEPCQVEPDLQVTVILLGETGQSSFDGRVIGTGAFFQQFLVAREVVDDMRPVGVKKPLQDKALICFGQAAGRFFSRHPVQVPGAVVGEIGQLADQHRRDVEGDMHIRVLRHHRSHVVIVFGGMHAHPGPRIDAVRIFIIQRLVLMPDQVNVQHFRSCFGRGRLW